MSAYDRDQTTEEWHLLRKLFLLLLLVIALAIGLVFLFQHRSNFPLLLFNIMADAGLGLVMGVATRLVLRGRNGLIQGLVSAAITLAGLVFLGYFTESKSGIGPFQVGFVTVHWLDWAHLAALRLPLQIRGGNLDLLDLAHMVIAVDTSWIALRVWKPAPRVSGEPARPAPRPNNWRPARTPQPKPKRSSSSTSSRSAPAPSRPAQRIQVPAVSRSNGGSNHRQSGRSVLSRPAIKPMRAVQAKPRRGNLLRRRPAVQLAVHEDHKCPYCLEPVSRQDPRGVVECPVCHTLHHKECWDVTGTCQVPHLNT